MVAIAIVAAVLLRYHILSTNLRGVSIAQKPQIETCMASATA